jgi:S1-C subfamily serine protease
MKGFRMGVPTLIKFRARTLLLVATISGLSIAAVVATPYIGAEGKFETLKAIQTERRTFAKALSPAVVAIAATRPEVGQAAQTGLAQGSAMAASGFVVDGEYVVTCIESGPMMADRRDDPFLRKDETVWMMAHDGTEFTGKIVGRDMRNLLLLVKMDTNHPKLPSLKFGDSDKVAMGSAICGFGNSLDSLLIDRQISMSYGTASGFYRFEPVDVMQPDDPNTGGDPYKGNVLEVDVATHDGDHGGPIINMDGEVVGMINAHFMAGRHLGCAVPSNQIRAVLPQLKKGVAEDDLAQADFGFTAKKPENSKDIFISKITPDGPAAKAGLLEGWQLVRIDNYRIPQMDRLAEMIGKGRITREREVGGMFGSRKVKVPVSYGAPVGTHIQITIRNPQDGAEKTVDLIVGEKAEDF